MTDPARIEQELEDFTVFGLGNTQAAVDDIAGVIADAEQGIGALNVPGQSDTQRHLQELLKVYKAQAAQAGIDMNAVSAAVSQQEGARTEHRATAPTDDDIKAAEQAVTDAKTALANGTGTQADVDAAVAHLSDLMKRRKDADSKLKNQTDLNAKSLKDVGDTNPATPDKEKLAELLSKAMQPQQQGAPPAAPPPQPQPAMPAGGSPQGGKGAVPTTSKTPFSMSDLEKVLGHPVSTTPMPRATVPATPAARIPTTVSSGPSGPQQPSVPGTTLTGQTTPENVSGRVSGASQTHAAAPGGPGGAGKPGGLSPMGGMPMMPPMGGMGGHGGGESNKVEKPKIVHKDDDINTGRSIQYAADGSVINEKRP